MTRRLTSLILLPAISAFTLSQHQSSSRLHYQTFPADARPDPTDPSNTVLEPTWIPMELISVLASEQSMQVEEFILTYVDAEAYTSCDDEGDELHECDFFGMYLGPTKWFHLTPAAHHQVDQIHFKIWQDAWENPHSSIDVADRVAKKVLSYYNEAMHPEKQRVASSNQTIRMKVIPASFGLEGFEDAIWEATQETLLSSLPNDDTPKDPKEAITFVVAAPDFSDPILTEQNCKDSSPQAEFASDSFKAFADTLQDKLEMFSELEDMPLDDALTVETFHPLWGGKFPYPCVAVATKERP